MLVVDSTSSIYLRSSSKYRIRMYFFLVLFCLVIVRNNEFTYNANVNVPYFIVSLFLVGFPEVTRSVDNILPVIHN